jgi:hypothetical protein
MKVNDSYTTLQQFFMRLGFSVIRDDRLQSFGNFIIEACSGYFCMKGCRDRSVESIELRALDDTNEWFILNVIMSFVLEEKILVEEISLEEQMEFVETHLDDLRYLFAEDHYQNTKSQLKELVSFRGKILFPEWYK